jgi:hypothetical protein
VGWNNEMKREKERIQPYMCPSHGDGMIGYQSAQHFHAFPVPDVHLHDLIDLDLV